MKLGTKLLGTFGVAATAVAIGLTPALAETLDVDGAAFVGQTTSLTCSGGTCTAGNGVPTMGGGGTFSFQSIACAGISVSALGEDNFPDAEVGPCSLSASGSYTNIVCGTGNVLPGASATLAEQGIGPIAASDTYSVSFGIQFAAGIGVVTGTAQETGDPDTEPPAPIVGLVVLTPVGTVVPPPMGECTTAFTVIGAAITTA